MSDARGDTDLVGHNVVHVPHQQVGPVAWANNIIVKAQRPEDEWIERAMRQIGDWRAKLRSTYIRWALATNGLDVAARKYDSPEFRGKGFVVTSLRVANNEPDIVPIATWDGPTAAAAHRKTMPMLAAFGIIDLYSNLEEVIFSLYRTFLDQNPDSLLQGDEFKPLRQLRRAAQSDPQKAAEWQATWAARLHDWQRQRIYKSGLGGTFRAFCALSKLKTPSNYMQSTTDTWAESIEILGLVRHSLVHGVEKVSPELAVACTKPYSMAFEFEEGDPLVISLLHLQAVDLFCEQLLNGLNLSLIELMPHTPDLKTGEPKR